MHVLLVVAIKVVFPQIMALCRTTTVLAEQVKDKYFIAPLHDNWLIVVQAWNRKAR